MDELLRKSLKLLATIFWVLIILLIIFWYSENKEKFFPSQKIEEIKNPVNPFR